MGNNYLGAIMGRSLRFFLARLGCEGVLASAFLFLIRAFLTAEALYMVPSSSAPVSADPQSQPVLWGQPVLVLVGKPIPKEDELDAISSGKYFSQVVHIPGEIESVSTIEKLGKLNGLLLYLTDKIFGGTIQSDYTKRIQQELDQTDEDSLPAKLDFIRRREFKTFGIRMPPEYE